MTSPEISQLNRQLEEMQKRITRSLAVEQELINSRHLLDQEIQRFKRISEYGHLLNEQSGSDQFAVLVTEAVIDLFELESGVVWLADSYGKLPKVPSAATDWGAELSTEVLNEWISDNLIVPFKGKDLTVFEGDDQKLNIAGIDLIIGSVLASASSKILAVVVGTVSTQRRAFYELKLSDRSGSFEVFSQLLATLLQNHADRKYIADQNRELEQQVRVQARELVKSEKMASLGTLAAGVAHEINNPIGYVMSNARLLNDCYGTLMSGLNALATIQKLGDKAPKELQEIVDEADLTELDYITDDLASVIEDTLDGVKRVAGIVTGLKRFSHPSSDTRGPVDLNECIRIAAQMTQSQFKGHAVLELNLEPIPEMIGNESELTQVFVNLIVNASHAMEDCSRGVLSIHSSALGNQIKINVRDTGSGIEEQHLEHLFEPFFTTKGVGQGTGLGLSISHSIVTSHQGQIDVVSQPGEGSCFTLSFPIAL